MATFKEADQVRVALKMKLSNYYWYSGSKVLSGAADFYVMITSKVIDNKVRKIVPPLVDGVYIKMELE